MIRDHAFWARHHRARAVDLEERGDLVKADNNRELAAYYEGLAKIAALSPPAEEKPRG